MSFILIIIFYILIFPACDDLRPMLQSFISIKYQEETLFSLWKAATMLCQIRKRWSLPGELLQSPTESQVIQPMSSNMS